MRSTTVKTLIKLDDRLTYDRMDRATFVAGPEHPMPQRHRSSFAILLSSGAIWLVLLCSVLAPSQAGAQVLLDDFNRPTSTTVGGGWTETETAAAGAQLNGAQQLLLSSTIAGREFISQDVSAAGLYNTQLNANTCLLTWAFCIRQSTADPSGFNASNYGVGYVLGATGSDLVGAGVQGYAVVYGQTGTTDNIRLVRFTNGLNTPASVLTNIIAGSDFGADYLAVKVTYDPVTGNWQLFTSTLLATGANFSSTNPTTAATSVGSAVNNTYTGINLPYTGCFWNHATGAAESALFDNIYVPQNCTPTVNFATPTGSANENVGTITVTLNFFPAVPAAGTVIVTVTDGPGMVYGVDYTSTPAAVGTDITVPVAAGATSATFTLTIVDDALDEGIETMSFAITNTTGGGAGGILLGSATSYVQTIIDNDGPPQVNFTTTNISVLETAGLQTFFINISPAPTAAGTITITALNGPGVVYGLGNDYLSSSGGLSPFTVAYGIGATSVSFTATVLNDLAIEVTEQVTYTITGVTGGPLASIGATNVATLFIGDNDAPPTALTAGDLAIVGVDANNGACSGAPTEDLISFFCFKPITTGTTIILTDNGYERCIAGRWGNGEGTVRMTRTGMAIPAGQVITFRVSNSAGAGNVIAAAPDAAWTCASLNGGQFMNMNVGGDQIFFMQGGTWTTNTVGGNDAQYSGTVLYGFSTNPSFPWSASCSTNPTQRSNLPLGMNCFSMAPTSASDYSKYTGTLAAATQRDWMIRIDSPANWTSYPNCGAYNAASPNWMAAPTLPIIVGGFTQGLWRGTTSTDWFDCKNWDDVEVPLATTNVTVNQVASNHCVVGITPGGTAVCASLSQSNAGSPINLTVQNTSSLAIGGPLTVQRTTTGFPVSLTVTGNSTLTATNCTVQGTTADEAILINRVPGNTVSFSGNFTIGTGGLVDLAGAGVGGSIFIGGNYTNLGPTETTLNEQYGSIVFNGAAAQSISTAGFQDVFYNLGIAKPAGNVTLNDPVAISNVLDLSNGQLITTATDLATILAGGSTTNASDASFVNGPLEKIGDTNFSFPVGKGSSLRPCGITGVTGLATDAFTSEYFPISAYTWGSNMESTLHHISDCEYWIIARSAGTANATVQLTWDTPESCGVTDLTTLAVARWDAAAMPAPIWRDRGNGGATGTTAAGTIPTAVQQTLFSPWTLASTDGANPLPIELIDFSAKPEGAFVRLDWMTGSEQDNDHFTIERSAEGIYFAPILTTPSAGNSLQSQSYTDLDRAPLNGINYYRLRQTDTDGTSTVSRVESVLMGWGGERPLLVFGNADVLTAMHAFPAGSRYEMQDMTGRLIATGTTDQDGMTVLYVGSLQRGAYVFRVSDGQHAETVRFVY